MGAQTTVFDFLQRWCRTALRGTTTMAETHSDHPGRSWGETCWTQGPRWGKGRGRRAATECRWAKWLELSGPGFLGSYGGCLM